MLLHDAMLLRSAALRRQRRSEKTIVWYEFWLKDLDKSLPVHDLDGITLDHLRQWIDLVITRKPTASTLRGAQISIKTFFRWCVAEGYLLASPADRLEVCAVPKRLVQYFAPEEMVALYQAAGTLQPTERNQALVLFLSDTGMRSSEVVGLQLGDVHLAARMAITIGKGDKERVVPFGRMTSEALQRWLEVRPAETASFFGLRHWGIRKMLDHLGALTGLKVNPHKFRKTCATYYALNGATEDLLQSVMGWESGQMAAMYINYAALVSSATKFTPNDHTLITMPGQLMSSQLP